MIEDVSMNNSKWFIKLFKGELPLFKTYWIFVINGIIFGLITKILDISYSSSSSTTSIILTNTWYWFLTIYNIFILIAIWKSCNNHKGYLIWRLIARIIVIFSMLISLSYLIINTRQIFDKDYAIFVQIYKLNDKLPQVIGNGIRLEKVYIEGNNINYKLTLFNTIVDKMDIQRFQLIVKEELKEVGCHDKELKEMLDLDKNIIYVYEDKLHNPITNISINKKDCF